jgi:hypothetical protein
MRWLKPPLRRPEVVHTPQPPNQAFHTMRNRDSPLTPINPDTPQSPHQSPHATLKKQTTQTKTMSLFPRILRVSASGPPPGKQSADLNRPAARPDTPRP